MQPSKPSKTFVFPMNFNDFTLQRNMIFDDFPDLFRYQFWHLFLMSFGIDFGAKMSKIDPKIQKTNSENQPKKETFSKSADLV